MRPRKYHFFIVKTPRAGLRTEMRAYVREAIRGWGREVSAAAGEEIVTAAEKAVVVGDLGAMERETLMNLRKDIVRYFEANELPTGTYHDVLKIVDGYLRRA